MRKKSFIFILGIICLFSLTGCTTKTEVQTYEKKISSLEKQVKSIKMENNQLKIQNDQLKKQNEKLNQELRVVILQKSNSTTAPARK